MPPCLTLVNTNAGSAKTFPEIENNGDWWKLQKEESWWTCLLHGWPIAVEANCHRRITAGHSARERHQHRERDRAESPHCSCASDRFSPQSCYRWCTPKSLALPLAFSATEADGGRGRDRRSGTRGTILKLHIRMSGSVVLDEGAALMGWCGGRTAVGRVRDWTLNNLTASSAWRRNKSFFLQSYYNNI